MGNWCSMRKVVKRKEGVKCGTWADLPASYEGPLGWKGAAKRYWTVVVKGEEKEQERKEREEKAFREELKAAREKKKVRAKSWKTSGKTRRPQNQRGKEVEQEEEKRTKDLQEGEWRKRQERARRFLGVEITRPSMSGTHEGPAPINTAEEEKKKKEEREKTEKKERRERKEREEGKGRE